MYFRQATKKTPIVVVDGLAIIQYLRRNSDWVCGGQLKEFIEEAKKFVTGFQNLGVQLVFFFDGPTANVKRETWIQRRLKSMQDAEEILRIVSQGNYIGAIPGKYFMVPAGLSSIMRWIFQTLHNCEV